MPLPNIIVPVTIVHDPKCSTIKFVRTNSHTDAIYTDIELCKIDGLGGNYTTKEKPTDELLKAVAARVIELYGPVTKYHVWYADTIRQWRIVFGN